MFLTILTGIWHIRYFFFIFCLVIIWTWDTNLVDALRWCRTDISSCTLSAKVSLVLDNLFPAPSLFKLNHINVCFIQISTKITCKQLIPFRESPFFWLVIFPMSGNNTFETSNFADLCFSFWRNEATPLSPTVFLRSKLLRNMKQMNLCFLT